MAKFRVLIHPLLIITAIGFALLVGGTMPYFLLYILLCFYFLPLIHNIIVLFFLKGSVKIPSKSLFTGDSIEIQYEVRNNSFLPIISLEIQSDISRKLTGSDSPNLILSLEKKQSYSTSEKIVLKRRGYYEVGEIIVTLKDVFGLYNLRKRISNTTSLLVYPETIKLSTFRINASQQMGDLLIEDSAFQDKSRINTIREYINGDTVKSIHWKLSAKRQIPIVKEFENRGDTNAIVFLDNEKEFFKKDIDRTLEDKMADTAISIINYCLSQNVEVKLETQNFQDYIEVKGSQLSDFKPFLETLARFKGNGMYDFKSVLIPRIENFNKGSTIVIITTNLDKTMGGHGIYLKMKNLNPLFIAITHKERNLGFVDQVVEKRLKQEGIPVYQIDYRRSIKEVLEVYYD